MTREPNLEKEIELKNVVDKKFSFEEVVLDGNAYINCEFDNCKFTFKGKLPFSLRNCKFNNPPLIQFYGNAGLTLSTLSKIYQDPAFRPIFEQTIINIKAGNLQRRNNIP